MVKGQKSLSVGEPRKESYFRLLKVSFVLRINFSTDSEKKDLIGVICERQFSLPVRFP